MAFIAGVITVKMKCYSPVEKFFWNFIPELSGLEIYIQKRDMVDAPWLSPREHSGAFFISKGSN
ncbi:hypothetical protein [Mastigocoleus sp. MO_188.B34]|uniref:hypothetical protein n=1 Tax=Mastigocoleus sp. MO_188.B34 TaxID=3036635 RepID=UPI0026308D07|nr:hypothetical protein [Mastigocoleus sp. MO_188.B34]